MKLSRTPTPQAAGGFAEDGLSRNKYGELTDGSTSSAAVSWSAAKARSKQVNGLGPSRSFLRRLSGSLPQWNTTDKDGKPLPRRIPRSLAEWKKVSRIAWQLLWRGRLRVFLLLLLGIAAILLYATPLQQTYRKAPWGGGGGKFVIILAANQGGGVMEWKGPREWAIERDSVRNKRRYAEKWGYHLEIVDMVIKKRYAHEWRESWEKVDTIRRCLQEYPDAEWFWWLDLNTFIMEPSYSLQKHIFNNLAKNTYRDINVYNPLNITHPPQEFWLDEISRSAIGDGKASSIDMIVSQDCSGFNLGSFFMRRSDWTERILDIWWDPVHYEQRHMAWEHKEQDVFEYLYASQPWVRSHTAFIEQRKLNSFPQGACGMDQPHIHYREEDRDFLVNMAGCEWGRDCWGEMYYYRELSYKLNRGLWRRIRDNLFGPPKEDHKIPLP